MPLGRRSASDLGVFLRGLASKGKLAAGGYTRGSTLSLGALRGQQGMKVDEAWVHDIDDVDGWLQLASSGGLQDALDPDQLVALLSFLRSIRDPASRPGAEEALSVDQHGINSEAEFAALEQSNREIIGNGGLARY